MIKSLLLSVALIGSIAATPSIYTGYTYSYTDYYRVTGSYETFDYVYDGLYFKSDYRGLLDDLAQPPLTLSINNGTRSITYGIIAYSSTSVDFSLDTFDWAILTNYDYNDRIDTSFFFIYSNYKNYEAGLFSLKLNLNILSKTSDTSYCVSSNYNTSVNQYWYDATYNNVTDRVYFGNFGYDFYSFSDTIDSEFTPSSNTHVGTLQFLVSYGGVNLDSYITGFNSGYTIGYNEGQLVGYSQGEAYGRTQGTNFFDLLTAIADTPVITLRSLFNVNIFGVNIFMVVTSLLTLLLVIWIIKKVLL